MKFKYTILFLALFGFTSFVGPETTAPSVKDEGEVKACSVTNSAFNPNEQLTFQVYYNWNFVWVKAGYVHFAAKETTYAGKPSYLFKATGRTHKSYDPFYKVRDTYQSYVDRETLKPHKFLRKTNQGGYTTYEEIRFDQDAGTITSKKGRTKEKARQMDFSFNENCMHDIVSILYYLRNIDITGLKKGDKVPINIFFEEKEYDLYVKYLGTETVKVKKKGKFKCHKFSPLLIAGDIFKENNKMIVYVTADDNKLPVLIESPIRVGTIKAVIAHTENLKYDMEAKVK